MLCSKEAVQGYLQSMQIGLQAGYVFSCLLLTWLYIIITKLVDTLQVFRTVKNLLCVREQIQGLCCEALSTTLSGGRQN